MRIGINGMGRIGRLAVRAALGGMVRPDDDPRAGNRLDIVHVNELKGGAATTAHLLEFDSVHGRWRERFGHEDNRAITIGNRRLGFSASATPEAVPWGDLGCDIVLECTGKFLTHDTLDGYFARGVKRVIVAAPVKQEGALNLVVGVNDHISLKPSVSATVVKSDIEAALKRTATADAKAISVAVHGSDVTLSGTVHNWAERETATNSAWGTPGVRKVVDRMVLGY